MENIEKLKIDHEKEIKNLLIKMNQLEKNNELFANALTLLIVGEENFCELLKLTPGIKQRQIYDYKAFYAKYLKDYRKQILINFKIDLKNRPINI